LVACFTVCGEKLKINCLAVSFSPICLCKEDPCAAGLEPGRKNLFGIGFYLLPLTGPAGFFSQVIDQQITGALILPVKIIAQLFEQNR
jgi:hypothetical protein